MTTLEAIPRQQIDEVLATAGWIVQHADELNLYAGRGIAVREFTTRSGFGWADYLLFVDQVAIGVIEAKPNGTTLIGVEVQSEKYSNGLPELAQPNVTPLPFQYQATGNELRFTNLLNPQLRSRRVFSVHRPETLASWLIRHHLSSRPTNALSGPIRGTRQGLKDSQYSGNSAKP